MALYDLHYGPASLAPISLDASSHYLLSNSGKRGIFLDHVLIFHPCFLCIKLLFPGNFIPPLMVYSGVRVQPTCAFCRGLHFTFLTIVSRHFSSPSERSLSGLTIKVTPKTRSNQVNLHASKFRTGKVWWKENKISQKGLIKLCNMQKIDGWKLISKQTPPSLLLELWRNCFKVKSNLIIISLDSCSCTLIHPKKLKWRW